MGQGNPGLTQKQFLVFGVLGLAVVILVSFFTDRKSVGDLVLEDAEQQRQEDLDDLSTSVDELLPSFDRAVPIDVSDAAKPDVPAPLEEEEDLQLDSEASEPTE